MKRRAMTLWCGVIASAIATSLAPDAPRALAYAAARGPIDEHAMFAAVGAMYSIDPHLLAAIAAVESAGRADALSPAGAQGLMQLMPATARRFRVSDPYDPIESALGAARFIAWLRMNLATDRGAAALPALLAAYNAGPAAVARYDGVPPYAETRDYVRRVLWLYLVGVMPPQTAAPAPRAARSRARHRAIADPDGLALERLREIRAARAIAPRDVPGGGAP